MRASGFSGARFASGRDRLGEKLCASPAGEFLLGHVPHGPDEKTRGLRQIACRPVRRHDLPNGDLGVDREKPHALRGRATSRERLGDDRGAEPRARKRQRGGERFALQDDLGRSARLGDERAVEIVNLLTLPHDDEGFVGEKPEGERRKFVLPAFFGTEGPGLFDQRALFVDGEKEALLIYFHRFESGLREGRNDERQVRLPRPHEVFEFAGRSFLKGDFDSRMRRAEDGEDFRQKEHLPVFRRPDHDASALASVDVLHRASAVFADFGDALFRFEEDPARFRERQRTRGAVEDFGTEVLFDSLHELRERRLRDAERLGGFGDAAGSEDGGEVAVGLEVHGLGMFTKSIGR